MDRLRYFLHSVSVAEAAALIGCSVQRVRALLRQGRLIGHYDRDFRLWSVRLPLDLRSIGKRGPLPRRLTNDLLAGVPSRPRWGRT